MGNEERLLELVGDIYEAGRDPRRWRSVLEHVCGAVRSPQGILILHDLQQHEIGFFTSTGYPEDVIQEYTEHYLPLDPWEPVIFDLPAGRMFIGEEVVPEADVLRSTMYNEWGHRAGVFHVAGGFISRSGSRVARLGLQRPRNMGPFESGDRRVLTMLQPHLHRALQLNRQFAALQGARRAAEDVLEHLRMGVILVDANARPVFVNRAARALAATGDGLRLGRDRVDAEEPEESRRLARLIGEAVRTANGEGLSPAGQMTVTRGSDGSDLHVLVSPLWPRALDVEGGPPRAALFVADPARREAVAEELLQARFGLTPAESRLAGLLAQGRSLHEIAEAVGVTRETARSQLKSVFAKTGVRRQAELVRLVLEGTVRASLPG